MSAKEKMNEIICRGCGKPENECTCNVPTTGFETRIKELLAINGELQEKIKKLEAINEKLIRE
jgi:hypothetical protein